MGNRYVKLHADKKSRKYEKKHTAKGYPKRYRLACRKAHEHLLQTGGVLGNNRRRMVLHEPLCRSRFLKK